MKKILILITDAASGHRSAAKALEKAIDFKYPNEYTHETLDILKILGIEPYSSADSLYTDVSSNKILEYIHNVLFNIVNGEIGFEVVYEDLIKKVYPSFEKYLLEYMPDLTISIHPTVSMLLQEFKKRNPRFKTATVVTDLVTLNRGWADKEADIVISPTIEATMSLVDYGVKKQKIINSLFPINPDIKNYRGRIDVLKELNFDSKLKTVLLTSGGSGSKSSVGIIKKLSLIPNLQIIILAGKLNNLKLKLEKKYKDNKNIRIMGYTNSIQDYYAAADIVIGKPGPATILEVSLFNKKMVITSKVGKQEEGNIDYALQSKNFMYTGNSPKKILSAIENLLTGKTSEGLNRHFDESMQIVEKLSELLNH